MNAMHIIYNMIPTAANMHLVIEVAAKNAYNPATRRLFVHPDVITRCNTSEAQAIIAHECGHVLQRLTWYFLMNKIMFVSVLSFYALGFFLASGICFILSIGILFFRWLLILTIEAHASYIAYQWLKKQKCANMKIVCKVYTEALKTYIIPFKFYKPNPL